MNEEYPLKNNKLYVLIGCHEEEVSAFKDPKNNIIVLGESWWDGLDNILSKYYRIKLNRD